MSYLLDTHTLLWWLADDKNLDIEAKKAISNSNNLVFVSAVNTWEITIKRGLGKLQSPDNLEQVIIECGFNQLPISIAHTTYVETLENLHEDPFDRLLIAQALCENLTLITRDNKILQYKIKTLKA